MSSKGMVKYLKLLKVKDRESFISCVNDLVDVELTPDVVKFFESVVVFLQQVESKDPKAFDTFGVSIKPCAIDVILFVVDLIEKYKEKQVL